MVKPMTTHTDEYNGRTNRETWAAHLHLSNTESTYYYWNEQAEEIFAEADTYRIAVNRLAHAMAQAVEEVAGSVFYEPEEATPGGRMMLADVGSLWRVNWFEIAGAWMSDASDVVGLDALYEAEAEA